MRTASLVHINPAAAPASSQITLSCRPRRQPAQKFSAAAAAAYVAEQGWLRVVGEPTVRFILTTSGAALDRREM
jgi:hypothetical protein